MPPDLADAAAKLRDTAAEAELLLREIRQSNGTWNKLLKDDDLYRDLKGLAADARVFLKHADGAVVAVEAELPNVRGFVRDGQDTMRSIRGNADALQRMPIIRGYVENAAALLVRPAHRREAMPFRSDDLFPPGRPFCPTPARRTSGRSRCGSRSRPATRRKWWSRPFATRSRRTRRPTRRPS